MKKALILLMFALGIGLLIPTAAFAANDCWVMYSPYVYQGNYWAGAVVYNVSGEDDVVVTLTMVETDGDIATCTAATLDADEYCANNISGYQWALTYYPDGTLYNSESLIVVTSSAGADGILVFGALGDLDYYGIANAYTAKVRDYTSTGNQSSKCITPFIGGGAACGMGVFILPSSAFTGACGGYSANDIDLTVTYHENKDAWENTYSDLSPGFISSGLVSGFAINPRTVDGGDGTLGNEHGYFHTELTDPSSGYVLLTFSMYKEGNGNLLIVRGVSCAKED